MPDNARNLPIYIWIHGGHFKHGTGQFYGGGLFTDEDDIVYVTIQYRLGHFGFLNVKDTSYTGNYGLMDQQMAIKFIYDNADKIGGDPNRITIGGESAGSISSSLQMLTPETSSMVSQAILQSGKPNAACGEWCQDVRGHVKGCCDYLDGCTTGANSMEQIVDQLRTVSGPDVYACLEAVGVGVSVNLRDGVFFKKDPYEYVRERSFKSNVNMLMGFTSYEGSLSHDSYPSRFDEKNFMTAYKEWPSELYHELKDINGADLDTLARRKFHQLACANEFQSYFDEMTKEEAVAMSLAIYGDIGFRVPGVAHARYYVEAGAKVFLYNFDTHEPHGGWLVGAAHADELKYMHGWGLQEPSWQESVGDFLINSWRSFIKNGDPSYPGHKWEPFDGKELHMEIENDENGVIARNDQYFDFDVFHRLDMSELEDEKPTIAECSVIKPTAVTTKPPDSYCKTLTISGGETSHYNIGGTYQAAGEFNGRRAWKGPGGAGWYIQYDGSIYCIAYGLGNAGCVAKSSFTMSFCPGDRDIEWSIWNKAENLELGTCSDRWCVTAPDLTTAQPPSTEDPTEPPSSSEAPTSQAPTTKKPTTQAPTSKSTTSDCSEVKLFGSIAKMFGYGCLYLRTSQTFNDYPVYKCSNGKVLFLRNDGYLAFYSEPTNDPGPPIWLERSSDSLCPTDNTDKFGFWNEEIEGPLKYDVAEKSEASWGSANTKPTIPSSDCSQVSVVGSIASEYSVDCHYLKTDKTYNDYPVYRCNRDGERKYIFMRNNNYLAFYHDITEEDGPLLWIENTSGTLCPSDNTNKFGFWNNGFDIAEPSEAAWGPVKDCNSFSIVGSVAKGHGLDCYYTKTSRFHNNFPVFECNRNGEKKFFYLRRDEHFGLHGEIEEGDGPLIWLRRTSNTLCPTDNNEPFGFWDGKLTVAEDESQVSFGAKPAEYGSSSECKEFTLHGSVARDYGLDCDYHRSTTGYNGYSVFECNRSGELKLFYLRKDGYFAFFTTTEEAEGPLIWLEKTSDTDCPTDNADPFGYWNFETGIDVAERSEVDWTRVGSEKPTVEPSEKSTEAPTSEPDENRTVASTQQPTEAPTAKPPSTESSTGKAKKNLNQKILKLVRPGGIAGIGQSNREMFSYSVRLKLYRSLRFYLKYFLTTSIELKI